MKFLPSARYGQNLLIFFIVVTNRPTYLHLRRVMKNELKQGKLMPIKFKEDVARMVDSVCN